MIAAEMAHPPPPPWAGSLVELYRERHAPMVRLAALEDISRLQGAASPEIMQDLKLYFAYVRSEVDPADPQSQERINWPADVRAALARIDVHDARLCRGAP